MSIKPELLGGFQDYLPDRMIARQGIFEKIRRVYERFGFLPLDTPAMERWNVLTGGKELDKSIFTARIVRGAEDRNLSDEEVQKDEWFTLRFDLTVSLSRVVAAYPDLPRPFKRYQIGSVWRGESPQKGRFREFTQFDIDTIGSSSMMADAEIVVAMNAVMEELGLDNFLIRINNRKILNGVAEIAGCNEREKIEELYRTVDKIGSIGIEGVLEELRTEPEKCSWGLGFSENQCSVVREFLSFEDRGTALLSSLQRFFQGRSIIGLEGVTELAKMDRFIKAGGVPVERCVFDPSVARGLGYYTGPVFEMSITGAEGFGSVFSGGRFDGLSDRFIPNSNIPGVGASVGVDRLIAVLAFLKKLPTRKSTASVLVTVFGDNTAEESFSVAEFFRSKGIKTELYVESVPLKGQVAYATSQEIPFVAIVGPDEVSQGRVSLKDMKARKQVTLTREEAADKILLA